MLKGILQGQPLVGVELQYLVQEVNCFSRAAGVLLFQVYSLLLLKALQFREHSLFLDKGTVDLVRSSNHREYLGELRLFLLREYF